MQDVIELNVGGKLMATKRSTLCQVKDSFLASMFGGSWDETKRALDKDGRVFLDFNPKHFAVILDYLREKAFTTSESALILPKIAQEEVESFCILIDYLGLSLDDMRLPKFSKTEAFEFQSGPCGGFKLEENGTVINATSELMERSEFRVVGQNIYERGVFRIKLKLEKMSFYKDSGVSVVRIGMIKEKLDNDKISDLSSPLVFYGWGVWREDLKMYSGKMTGTQCQKISEWRDFRQVQMVELILDCDAAKLYLNTKDGDQFNVDLPKWTKYRLMIQCEGGDFKIRIVDFHKGY